MTSKKERLAFVNDTLTAHRADDKDYQSYREQLEEGLLERK